MTLYLDREKLNTARSRILTSRADADLERLAMFADTSEQIDALAHYQPNPSLSVGPVGSNLGDDNPEVQQQRQQAQAQTATRPISLPPVEMPTTPRSSPILLPDVPEDVERPMGPPDEAPVDLEGQQRPPWAIPGPDQTPQGTPVRSASEMSASAFTAGKNPEGQARVYQAARASGRSDEDARILAAVTETEGGWGGAVGDQGQARGIYQFHERGEMPAFRAWLAQNNIQGDPNQLAYDPDVATRFAATTYLGQALDEGRRQGLSGADLATYVQRHGQRSVAPETTGANYRRLYGAGARPGATPAEQTPAAQAQANAALDVQSITSAYEGKPYVFGGPGGRSDPRLGVATDCSGFVASVWKNTYGIDLPAHTDTSYNQLRKLGAPEVAQKDARPGDVVYYMGAGTGGTITHHMGIYAGNGKVLDMSTSGGSGVRTRDVGHAGKFVILRDPRVNPEQPRRTGTPPEIVETGYAERTPTAKVTPREVDAVIAAAPPDGAGGPQASQPTMLRTSLGDPVPMPTNPPGGPADSTGMPPPPGATFPVDPRPAPTYDREGIDRTNDALTPIPGAPGGSWAPQPMPWPQLEMDPATLLRRPLGHPQTAPPGQPVPMPEDASQSERYIQQLSGPQPGRPAVQQNIVPFDPATGALGDSPATMLPPGRESGGPSVSGDVPMFRQPLSQQPELPPDEAPLYGPPIEEAGPASPIPGPDLSPMGTPIVDQPPTYGPPLSEAGPPAPVVPASIAPPEPEMVPPGSPYAPDVMPEAPPERFAPRPGVGQVVASPGEPDYVDAGPQTVTEQIGRGIRDQQGPGGLLEPAGGGPRIMSRLEEIEVQAALEVGHDLSTPQGFLTRRRAVQDPDWRARNPALADEYDQLSQQLGLTIVGQAGDASRANRFSGPTVEVLQEQLEAATSAWTRATRAGDDQMATFARERAVEIESQLVDARNARLRVEPAIASDVGRRVNPLTMTDESADTLADAMRPVERVTPESAADLGGPASVVPRSISLNAGLGMVPEGTPDRMRPRYAYRNPNALNTPGAGLVKVGEERVIGREVDATRDVTLANADHLSAVRVRAKAEAVALRRPGDQEAQQGLMDAVAAEERAKDTLDAAREWLQVVKTGDATFATTGTTPPMRGTGALSAFNRAASEAIVGGTGGAVIEQARNPEEDPRTAAARGFALGAAGFPIATRLARGAARAAGAATDAGGGARISLGDVPPSRITEPTMEGFEGPRGAQRAIPNVSDVPNQPGSQLGNVPPSQVNQTALPGVEPPYTRTAIPDVSDAPNRPPVLGDVPPSQIGQAELPGLGLPEPRPISEVAEEVLGASTGQAPVPRGQGEGGQLSLPSVAPSVLSRLRRALAPHIERAGTVRYASMLSDTAGHSQNIQGNLVMQLADLATTPIAATIDAARVGTARLIGGPVGRRLGTQREVFFGEVGAQMRGMGAGARQGIGEAVEILRTGVRPSEADKLDRAPAGFGTNIPVLAPAGSRRAGMVNTAVELPLRALSAADAIFRGAATNGHLAAESLAEATRLNRGRAPSAEQIQQAMQSPKVRTRVDELAARSVLQEDRALSAWYRKAIREAPPEVAIPVQTAVPFVRTPYNIVAQGMGLTDVGALAGVIEDVAKGRAARRVEQRLARAALGVGVMAWATADYANGTLTGPYPSDQREASTLPPGWRPWSRKVEAGGETYYVPMAALGPFAVPAVYAVLRAEAIKQGKDAFSAEWAGDVAMAVGRYAEQNTFMEGLSQISKIFDERTGEATANRMLNQAVSSYAPHIAGGGALGREIQRVVGMPSRDPQNPGEAFAATFPYLADQVQPRQDVLGREQSLGLGGPAGTVLRAGVESDDPVISAFREANQALPSRGPASVVDPVTKQAVQLDANQRAAWERAFGDALQTRWASSGYAGDARALANVASKAREDARRAVIGR